MQSNDLAKNPIWRIINDREFPGKCKMRDPVLLAELQTLTTLPIEALGQHAREAFARTTDQRVGKFIRALSDAMTEEAVGDVVQVLFSHCKIPQKQHV